MTTTGYNKGRPRIGEIRPLTIGGLRSQQVREAEKKKMGEKAYKLKMAIYSQLWKLANKEKYLKINRAYAARRKNRLDPRAIFITH